MLKKALTVVGLMATLMSGGVSAQARQEVNFTLEATISSPGLTVTHTDNRSKFTTTATTDNGNPLFSDPLRVDITHPDAAIEVKLASAFFLTGEGANSTVTIPMLAKFGAQTLSAENAVIVANAGDAKNTKTINFEVSVEDDKKEDTPAGTYNGTLSLMFEVSAASQG
ncbi:MAG: hypothetical protein JHC61_02490 [Burkholderiaceae bacterium]|nr:hypothetical protein [Burkholderiaceae bacterium]